jgi:glutaminase
MDTMLGRHAVAAAVGMMIACGGSAPPPVAAPPTQLAAATDMGPASSGRPVGVSRQKVLQALETAHKRYKGLAEGKNADYIPILAQVDPELFGISVALTNGEILEVGDSKHPFSIQSISKVYTLARILEDIGADVVEKTIGLNATGRPFNSLFPIELNKANPAGNPFVNPGAIAAVSLVPGANSDERWQRINATYGAFAGRNLTVDEEVYKSESSSNERNRGIAWLLKNAKIIPGDPQEALDLYTRQCSVSVTARDLSIMGATLGNGGVNPITGQRLVSSQTAARVLAEMMTNGLYENSGAWAFKTGLPAKSGVGGGIVAVVPGRFGIAAFSPRLDEAGNSVRSQRAIESIVVDLAANLFASQPLSAGARSSQSSAESSSRETR